MQAEIFFLERQRDLYEVIRSSLRRNLYDNVEVKRWELHDSYSQQSPSEQHEIGSRYLDLLKASMIKTGDFSVQVEDHHGNWGYLGKEQSGEHFLRVFHASLPSIFPAVAVMGRMVMVPEGIQAAFDSPRDFSHLLKPLDLQGVLLVDFEDEQAIHDAVRKAARQLKIEITLLCRQYMSLRRIPWPHVSGLSWLANLLEINPEFIERYEDELIVPPPQLTSTILSDPVRVAKRSKVVLRIDSKQALGSVRVKVRAPCRSLNKPVARHLDFSSAGVYAQIEFELVARARPFCPLEVVLALEEPAQTYIVLPPVILDVVA